MSAPTTAKIWVSKIKRGKLRVQRNAYTGAEDERQTMWRVTFTYDRFPDRALDLWFQDDAEASRFALQGLHDLAEVLAAIAPLNSAFTAQPPLREPRIRKLNPYTDQPERTDSWHSLMWNEQYNRWSDLWYGDDLAGEALAAQWSVGQPYGVFDFFRVFNVLVLFYPSAEYVKEISLAGFFDQFGFHKPGVYPHGVYPQGFSLGGFIDLERADSHLGMWVPVTALPGDLRRSFLLVFAQTGVGVGGL